MRPKAEALGYLSVLIYATFCVGLCDTGRPKAPSLGDMGRVLLGWNKVRLGHNFGGGGWV